MEAIDAYRIYLGVKNHFTLDSYDYIKYNRKVNVSNDSFLKRKDKLFFAKLGNRKGTYLEHYLVANIIHDPKMWIGEFLSEESEDRYKKWIEKRKNLSSIFKEEMQFVRGWNSDTLDKWFAAPSRGDHPNIVKKFLRKEISLETLTILNSILNFLKKYDNEVHDPIYKEVSKLCRKYQPFLEYDRSEMKKILREIVLSQ